MGSVTHLPYAKFGKVFYHTKLHLVQHILSHLQMGHMTTPS